MAQNDLNLPSPSAFEFRRLLDGLRYRFEKSDNGANIFVRADGAVIVSRHSDLGWAASDAENGLVRALPWALPKERQADRPPEGEWVSNKDGKSYVYLLVYV